MKKVGWVKEFDWWMFGLVAVLGYFVISGAIRCARGETLPSEYEEGESKPISVSPYD